MALSLSDLTAFTQQDLVERSTDVIFKESPLLARMLSRRRMAFEGGLYIQRPLIYNQLNGSWFGKGDTLNIAYVTTDTAVTVNIKTVYVNISLYFIDNILNRGRAAAYSIVESKFANASMTMAKLITQALYQDGQSSSPGTTGCLSNSLSLDGLLAWVDDGNSSGSYTTASDLTKSFLAVGGQTRTDFFAGGLPTAFSTAVTPIADVQGLNAYCNRSFTPFTLNDVNTAYGAAWFGRDFPDLITTTQTGYNRMWNAIQPLQRYNMDASGTDVGKIGFNAFQFNASTVVVDKYMPEDGTNGMMLGLNTNYLELYSSTAKSAQFGFTGFKEAQQSLDVAGQFVWAGNLINANPRTAFKLVGPVLY
jgi:hypothetical protein